MRHTRRALLASAAGTAALAGCVSGYLDGSDDTGGDGTGGDGTGGDDTGSGTTTEDVSLLLNWQPSGLHVPYYVASDRGYYRDEGLDVSIESGQGSDFSATQVALGNEDFGITSSDQVLAVGSEEDIDLRSVGIMMQRGPVVVFTNREDFGTELTDPAQLEGLSLGSGPGMVEQMTRAYLSHHDLLDSIDYVDSGFDTIQQLLSGQIDAAAGVFSDVVDARHQDATIDVLNVDDAIPSYGHLVATNTDRLESDPDSVRGFLRATARGAAWAYDHPDEGTDVLVDNMEELEGAWENNRDKWAELGQTYMLSEDVHDHGWGWSSGDPWNQTYETLSSAGFIDEGVDVDALWTNDYLDTDDEYVGSFADRIDG